MSSGRYFNKGVKALDSPHVGHVVREADDLLVVFGAGGDRYDIPKDKIRFASGNVLVDLPFHEIVRRYRVSRDRPLPSSSREDLPGSNPDGDIDLASYEKKYPDSLFNKGVRTQDEEHLGHVMKETKDRIVVRGHYDWRFDVPKDKIIAVGRDVILGLDYGEAFKKELRGGQGGAAARIDRQRRRAGKRVYMPLSFLSYTLAVAAVGGAAVST